MNEVTPGLRVLLKRGARLRCPACGVGRIFRSFLRLREDCPECGWLLEREPGAVTGAMYLVSIVSQFFAVALWLLLWWLTDWSPWVMIALAVPLIALFSIVALPLSKSLWVAVEYYTDLVSGDAEMPEYQRRAFPSRPSAEGATADQADPPE